jgi:hypothetical protein
MRVARIVALSVLTACGAPQTAPTPTSDAPPPPASATTDASATPWPKGPLDASRIAAATGGKAETTDDIVRVSFPREDVPVEVDGWAKMPPFMGLTSWAAFARAEKEDVEAMVMGDLVLFEDEVNPVMSALLERGVAVTALHNHFFFDKPHVYFMHIEGEGSVYQLGKGVKAALDAEKAVRARAAQPASAFGAAVPKGPSKIDGAKLDGIFGVRGQSKDGMYKTTMGRKVRAPCGCTIGKAMGVNTWAAFGGTDDNAIADGDFAVAENELQPVLKTLRAGRIEIVAIHSHMTGESPRILFLHYWAHGRAADIATGVRRALDLTAWDGTTATEHF